VVTAHHGVRGKSPNATGITNKMRRLAYFFVLLFLALSTFFAPTAKAQGTFTAASCNRSDVNAVINGPTHTAVDGDVINIPAGSCTWNTTTGVAVRSGIGISIIGAGQGSTTITDKITGSGAMFSMNPAFGNSLSRISSMTLLPTVPNSGFGNPIVVNGTCTPNGCPNFRLDHLTAPSSWAANGLSDDSFAYVSNVFGVADHNVIGDVRVASNGVDFINVGHGSWQGVGSWGDNSWASADTFGTAQAFYIEDNVLSNALITDTDIGGASGGGARLVCRFNTINNISSGGGCTGHGTDTTGRARGVRQWEAYYNVGECTNSATGCGSFEPGRSGVGRSFGNSFTNVGGGFMKGLADLDTQRRWRPDSPWGACDGSSPWDTNDGVTYYSGTIASVSGAGNPWTISDSGSPGWSTNNWVSPGAPYSVHDIPHAGGFEVGANTSNSITNYASTAGSVGATTLAAGDSYQILRASACLDQPSRGAGLLVTGTKPTMATGGSASSVNQALDPTYEANDSLPGTADHTIDSDSRSLVANRDFFVESVNQAAQTSPTSPFAGSGGTGHGTLANRPSNCAVGVGYWATDQGSWNQSGSGAQGELFVCTATNSWSLSYTPYTYPHPLIAGGTTGTGGNPPNPPAGLEATVQ
jgi:hypothetical protein